MTSGGGTRTGLGLLALFLAMSATRDVFFAWVFQIADVFTVTALVFGAASALFVVLTWHERRQRQRAPQHLRQIVAVNVLTAAAWLAYLWAIKLLEPAVASTIWSGAGPLVVAALATRAPGRLHLGPAESFRRLERLAHLGILGTIAFLGAIAVSGRSGGAVADPWQATAGVALAAGSGAVIAVAILVTKQLHDADFSAGHVLALRFWLLVVVAAGAGLVGLGDPDDAGAGLADAGRRFGDAVHLIPAGLLLISLPIYAMQAAVVRLRPMTVEAVAALGPPLVFMLQAFDGRLSFSPFTMAGVASYALCTTVAVIARLVPDTGAGGGRPSAEAGGLADAGGASEGSEPDRT